MAGQVWPGIEVVENLQNRGRGIVTTKEFLSDEVVCDYGGKFLSFKVGNAKYNESSQTAMGFMYLFPYKGSKYYRDATQETADAGRLVYHSKCHANVSYTITLNFYCNRCGAYI